MYQSTGSSWAALTVAGSSLVANSVTAAQIAAGTITAAQISSGYVYAGNISANQITTGTLNAADIAVTNLNASNITAGDLNCSAITLQGQNVSTFLNGQGSIIPLQPFTFPYSTTTTSITITWTAQTLYRADGSTVTISAGSKTYSGLTASTSYVLYPYINVSSLTLQFTASPGPSNSYNAVSAYFDGRFPLGVLSFTTPGSGSGGGGGGYVCPEASEMVDVQGKGNVRADEVRIGDMIRGYDFAGKRDVYRRVLLTNKQHKASWRVVDGHRVSPIEEVYFAGAWQPAYKASSAVDSTVSNAVHITVEASDDGDHNYYLVAGAELLIHNTQYAPC
jgi:hypothetical protein